MATETEGRWERKFGWLAFYDLTYPVLHEKHCILI